MVRIGAVAYLNTRPLVFGLEQGTRGDRFALSYDVPSVLADRMHRGELDLALLPVIELAGLPELEVVPGLGIVTRGDSASVLLVSKRPVRQIQSVALDRDSRTSNALVQVLFAGRWGVRPRCVPGATALDEALGDHDAVVRIGDKALFETPPADCEVHDLGRAWTDWTGLPFVFAVWAARPGIVDRELYRALHDSRRAGSRALGPIAEDYTWQGRQYPGRSRDYLERNIHFGLGAAEIRAMKRFFGAAAELGLIQAAPPIKMALEHHTGCHESAGKPKGERVR